jgi:uncharacterized iron-regulated membrane protein
MPSPRRLILLLHIWTALILCLPVVLQGLTGAAIVVVEVLHDQFVVAPSATGGTPRGPAEIVTAAQVAAPSGFVPTLYVAPAADGAPANVRFAPPGRGGPALSVRIDVDPVTLDILDIERPNSATRVLHLFHSNLLLEDRHLVGWIGVAMFVLGITGLVNWWPRPGRWRAGLTIRTNARGIFLYRQLHGTAGIWGLLLFLMASLSGMGMAFPDTARSLVDLVSTVRDPRTGTVRIEPMAGTVPIGLDAAAALALDTAPGMHLALAALPQRPDQPYRLSLLRPGQQRGTPPLTMVVDPWRRRIVSRLDPRDNSTGETILGWLHAIHSGIGIGTPWQGLIFITGLLPLLFASTGLATWFLKRRRRLHAALARMRIGDTVVPDGSAGE